MWALVTHNMVSWCLLYFTTKSLKEKILPGHQREGHLKQSSSGGRIPEAEEQGGVSKKHRWHLWSLIPSRMTLVKTLLANAEGAGSILGSGRSPGGGNGNPLQCSCLGNLMDRGAWQAAVHGVEKESDMTEWLNNNEISTLFTLFIDEKLLKGKYAVFP